MLAKEASIALANKEYERASRLLRKAILLNDDDAGAAYNPCIVFYSGDATLDHGRRQAFAMLADRPQMSAFLSTSDDLWKWAVLKYSARINGGDIDWSPSPTGDSGFRANHTPPVNGDRGIIRVDAVSPEAMDKAVAFEQLWMAAAFELHNIEGARGFVRLAHEASRGELTEEAFVRSIFMLEWGAAERTRRFYVEVYLPHAMKYGLRSDPTLWYCTVWGSKQSVFARYSDKRSYPWGPYSRYYRKIAPMQPWQAILEGLWPR
jgi:hypothetical protein